MWKQFYSEAQHERRNQAFLRELGVDEPIDYEKTRFEDVVHDLDAVLDTLGRDTQNRSWTVLKKGGILVSIVAPPSAEEPSEARRALGFLFCSPQFFTTVRDCHQLDYWCIAYYIK